MVCDFGWVTEVGEPIPTDWSKTLGLNYAFGLLDMAVSFLKKLTKESLFVEWIDPSDSAIEFFKHTKYNRDFIKEPYNKENFISALKNNFTKVEKIADIIPTRQLYLAVV